MKRIEELGISPTPWKNRSDRIYPSVDDAQGFEVAELSDNDLKSANARLMKSAPRLYKALYGLLFENAGSVNCRICEGHDCEHCPLGEAHKALEEASEGIVS